MRSPYRDIVISEVTGNIISDSVVVNIENSSSSEQSHSENDNNFDEDDGQQEEEEEEADDATGECQEEEEEDEEEEDDVDFTSESGKLVQNQGSRSSEDDFDEDFDDEDDDGEQMNHNDWEVRMLAAELQKREHVSTDLPSDLDENDGLLRRRRKRSDTDTEGSGAESHTLRRPRAASLDQFNLRRGASLNLSKHRASVYKAMSFDRDKDRL